MNNFVYWLFFPPPFHSVRSFNCVALIIAKIWSAHFDILSPGNFRLKFQLPAFRCRRQFILIVNRVSDNNKSVQFQATFITMMFTFNGLSVVYSFHRHFDDSVSIFYSLRFFSLIQFIFVDSVQIKAITTFHTKTVQTSGIEWSNC